MEADEKSAPGAAGSAVTAEGIRKRYGAVRALDGFDLTVPEGTVCGLLGPNGAGKTTAVRVLTTLLRFDGGRSRVAGFDISGQADQVRPRIGLAGQYAAVDELLTGRENLVMFGRLYHLKARAARQRADDLLERFALTDAAGKRAERYSGGMRRRLDLAASLILTPPVLFLDEPTTGLDPRSRNGVWDAVRTLASDGTTVLLTTQYLAEADHLADQVAVLDRGRTVAAGAPDHLKSRIGGERIDVTLHDPRDLAATAETIRRIAGTEPDTDPELRHVSASVADPVGALTRAVHALHDADLRIEDIGIRRPTLDEVFLHVTESRSAAPEKEEEVAS